MVAYCRDFSFIYEEQRFYASVTLDCWWGTTVKCWYELLASFLEGGRRAPGKRSSSFKIVFLFCFFFTAQNVVPQKPGETRSKLTFGGLSCFKLFLNHGGLLEGLLLSLWGTSILYGNIFRLMICITVGCWYELFVSFKRGGGQGCPFIN